MIVLLWLAGVADLVLTAWGLSLGVIREANPVLAWAFDVSPLGTVITGAALTGAIFYGLHLMRDRSRLLYPGLWILLGVRVAVLWLHMRWVTSWLLA